VKLAAVAVAYHEPRFIAKYIQAMQDRVQEIVVLNSAKPWHGEHEDGDKTATIASSLGATVVQYDWPTEHEQRNAGQEICTGYDWVIVLDPDEFLTNGEWEKLYKFLETADGDAYVCQQQNTYWKKGYIIDPPEDYRQIIAVRPSVRFFDKRCVDCSYKIAPVTLDHFSWARTNEECLRKISHYAHADELDPNWYKDVWLSDRTENLHPLTPESLKRAVRVQLPEELEALDLWP
jgi:glycosyltransferase involved in cell wall biosynthesis